jgi:hypothetical protein
MDADLTALYNSTSATVTDRIDCHGVQAQRDWLKYVQSLQAGETQATASLLAEVKRKADAAEALVPMTPVLNGLADIASRMGASGDTGATVGSGVPVAIQVWSSLYQYNLNARKTALSTSSTDATLTDIVRDAVLMTNQAFDALEARLL